MATIPKRGLPEVWPSSLTGLLSGEQQCVYRAWFPAHFSFEKLPSTFDFAAWKVEHTALVLSTVQQLKKEGWTTKTENENLFALSGTTCRLVGKPDIVAKKGARIRVMDCKTGKPSDSHGLQVAIYMIALPLSWERPNLFIDGQVVYKGHAVHIEPESVGPIKPKLFELLRRIGAPERVEATPSEPSCRYCDISVLDCPNRWTEGEKPDVLTSEF